MPNNPEHKALSVLPLNPGNSALLESLAGYMGACAAVCLDRGRHQSGVPMAVEGDYNATFRLTWESLTEKHRRSCADLQEATEYGAYGLAILVVRETTGKTFVQRSAKGPGFDFWIGDEEDSELPFQGLVRLEVSGILSGDGRDIKSRARVKRTQVGPSDDLGPSYIAIVEFGRPLTRLEKK